MLSSFYFRFPNISDVTIAASLVDDDFCAFVCDDNYCLTGNTPCDGIVGCPDGSDEYNCVRINSSSGYNVIMLFLCNKCKII